MSRQNVVSLHSSWRTRSAVGEDSAIAMLVVVSLDAMLFAGMLTAFVLTRLASNGVWPPADQPWLPLEETALVNTAALLGSGALVFLATRAWRKREARIGGVLTAAIALGVFFVFFQGVALLRQGPTLVSSHHGIFFGLIVAFHAAQTLGAVTFLGVTWVRRERGSGSTGGFSAARILLYFVVGVWPALYLCLYR